MKSKTRGLIVLGNPLPFPDTELKLRLSATDKMQGKRFTFTPFYYYYYYVSRSTEPVFKRQIKNLKTILKVDR